MRLLALAAPFTLGGCLVAAVASGPLPRTGDGGVYPRHVRAPTFDRCAAQPAGLLQGDCRQSRDETARYVRQLAIGDEVCLAGNPLVKGVTPRCEVRAYVEDVSPREVKLEIRDAPNDSRFRVMDDYWFEEAALVDLSLESAGFPASAPAATPAAQK